MLFRICRQAQNIAGAVFILRACTVSTEILTTRIPTLSYGFLTFFGAHTDTFREETTGNRLTGYGMVWEARCWYDNRRLLDEFWVIKILSFLYDERQTLKIWTPIGWRKNIKNRNESITEKGGITVTNNRNKKIILKHEYDMQGKIICYK